MLEGMTVAKTKVISMAQKPIDQKEPSQGTDTTWGTMTLAKTKEIALHQESIKGNSLKNQ